MTLKQFYADFAEHCSTRKWELTPIYSLIRGYPTKFPKKERGTLRGLRARVCPITHVCNAKNGTEFQTQEVTLASKKLGLRTKLMRCIVAAADDGHVPEYIYLAGEAKKIAEIRQKLLSILNLSEPA